MPDANNHKEVMPDCNHIWKPTDEGLKCETCDVTSDDLNRAAQAAHMEWVAAAMNRPPGGIVVFDEGFLNG